ncbi:MAG TPA: CHASE3 domain-containing protein [Pirellulales bacterium]|jgi:PAS domain S-box-containing protein
MKRLFKFRTLIVVSILAVLVVNRLFAHRNIERLNDDLKEVAHTHHVLDLTSDVLTAVLDAESGQRDFLITGSDTSLQPYQAALTRVDTRLQQLSDATQDNPRQQQRIAMLGDLIDAHLSRLKTAIELRRQDERLAQLSVVGTQGKEQLDAIRSLIGEMKDEETALLTERNVRSNSTYQFAILTNLVTAIAALIIFLTYVVLLNRSLAARQSHTEAIQSAHQKLQAEMRERSHAEQALRESERIYRAIGESIDYGIWLCDPDGKNTYTSPSFLRLVGLTQQQCSEFGWGAVLHPDDAERTIEAWKECVRARSMWDRENRFRGRDGAWHPVLARGVPVEDEEGRLVCWAGINLDIGRMKQAEKKLQQAHDELEMRVEQRTTELTSVNEVLQREVREHAIAAGRLCERAEEIEALMDILPIAVCIAHDPACHTITGNSAAYELMRLHPGMNLSRTTMPDEVPADFRALLNGSELSPAELPMQRAVTARLPVRDAEFELVRADGSVRHIYADAVPLFDNAGNVRGGIATCIDVTERRALEESDRRRQQDRLSSLATLAAGIAHEINNPVGTILLAAEMGLASDERARQALTDIAADARRCGEIVRNVLQFARGETMERQPADLNAAVSAACNAVADYVRGHECLLHVALDAGLPQLEINARGIEQVVENLVRNAAEASTAGGMIDVLTEAHDKSILIVVRDQGAGIAPDALRRIREPFFTTRRNRGGTGLGLSIANSIVTDHNGTLRFQTTPGKGTSVTIELPKTWPLKT